MNSTLRRVALVSLALVLAAGCADDEEPTTGTSAEEDSYPEETVTWIVPFAAGGGADAAFRVFQKYAEPLVDVEMPIINVEGAGGVTGWTQFLNSDPNGYTLSLATPPFNIIPKVVQPEETPYELGDFKYICSYASSPNAVFMKADESRFTDLESMVEFAEANPAALTAGVTGAVGTDTIHMYQLQREAGIEFTLVPFESGADAAQALTSGQIDLVFSDTSWVQLGAGEMTALAVSSAEPHPDFPDIPTYTDAGYDIVGVRMRAPAAPPETPDNVMAYWEDICKQVTEDEAFQEELSALGQPLEFLTGEEATAIIEDMTADIETIVEEEEGLTSS